MNVINGKNADTTCSFLLIVYLFIDLFLYLICCNELRVKNRKYINIRVLYTVVMFLD